MIFDPTSNAFFPHITAVKRVFEATRVAFLADGGQNLCASSE
jgi:hypothetical protein